MRVKVNNQTKKVSTVTSPFAYGRSFLKTEPCSDGVMHTHSLKPSFSQIPPNINCTIYDKNTHSITTVSVSGDLCPDQVADLITSDLEHFEKSGIDMSEYDSYPLKSLSQHVNYISTHSPMMNVNLGDHPMILRGSGCQIL